METNTQLHATDAQSLDAVFELLRDERRRHVVRVFAQRDGRASLREVATAVAARETGTDPAEVSAETTDEVATTLHHVHLPKLADADVVAYDAGTNTVLPARTGGLASLLRAGDGR